MSLLVAAGAAAILFLIWRVSQGEKAPEPFRRTLTDAMLEYKCEAGHGWTAPGRIDPRVCPTCLKPAHPVGFFSCPDHGRFEVAARFVRGADGRAHPSEFRVEGQDWGPAQPGVSCPTCGRTLKRVPPDLQEQQAPKQRKRGG